MKTSESITEIAKALLSIQNEIGNIKKSGVNPFFHSSYATLDDILDAVKPVCNKHGVSILQDVEGSTVSTMLLHESGEWIQQGGISLPTEKNTPQSVGSSITYGRRYTLTAILGLATEQDDDGNATIPKQEGVQKGYDNKGPDFKEIDGELLQCDTLEKVKDYAQMLNDEYPNMSDKVKSIIKGKVVKRGQELDATNKVVDGVQGKLVNGVDFDVNNIPY